MSPAPKCDASIQEIVFLNYNTDLYDFETQKNVEEAFFNLVLLREIIDNANNETKEIMIKPILKSLSIVVNKIKPILETEKEIVATLKGVTFKIKKDGAGNVCFGSPIYFMCLNPSTNELYPYINDMLVVFHILRKRSTGNFNRDENVETILNTILSNVMTECDEEISKFYIDYSSKYDDMVLTKLFNSKLDKDILSSLMMIILFTNKNKFLEDVVMENDGTFIVNNSNLKYIQQFHSESLSNMIPYKIMKHALYNMCYAKYTLHGFSMIASDSNKLPERKKLINDMLKIPLCQSLKKEIPILPDLVIPEINATKSDLKPLVNAVENIKSILKSENKGEQKTLKKVTFE